MKELKRLLPYIKKYKLHLIIGFLLICIANILETLIPKVVGSTIDLLITKHFTQSQIIENVFTILGLTAGSGILVFFTRKTIIVTSRNIEYDLRKDYLDAIQFQPMNFFHNNPTGNLMAFATNDIVAAREFLGPAIMFSANTISVFLFALYFMISLNASITLMVMLPFPLIAIFTYLISKKIYQTFKDVQDKFAELTSSSQESFSGLRHIKAYVREDFESNLFGKYSYEYLTKNLKYARVQSLTMPAFMILVGMSLLIVLGYGGYKVISKDATIGDISQFFIYVGLLIWPVAAIGWITNVVQRASASAGRLGKIFDAVNNENNNPAEDKTINNINGDIVFKNVVHTYNHIPSLQNLSFTIPSGSSFGIVGTIGSGKTTIINLISKLYTIESGNIFINNIPIEKIPFTILRKEIGIVQQESFLFSTTIAENIKFAKPDASLNEIIAAAKIAQLHDDVLKFPEQYDTLLGERGISLSGGQKQRVAIARVILKNPNILILDDATSSIDTLTEGKILHNLKNYIKGKTLIVISHRISAVKDCDNIIQIQQGQIIESGNHLTLLEKKGKYYEIYFKQSLEAELENM